MTARPTEAVKPGNRGWSRDFRLLFASDATAQLGSQVTMTVLPLVAIAQLDASGTQLGVLQALYMLPFLALPLLAGVWIDRRSRRPVLILCDLVRAALVVTVSVAAWLGVLTLPQLFLIALLGGCLSVVYDISLLAYVPTMVGRSRLDGANSALGVNQAVGGTVGPALSGVLVRVIGGPATLLVDAVCYLFSGLSLALIRHREPTETRTGPRNLRREVAEGLRAVWRTPPIRAIVVHAGLYNLGMELLAIAFLVRVVTDLDLGTFVYGMVLTAGGVGAIGGALLAPVLIRRIGYGPAVGAGVVLGVLAYLALPLAGTGGTAIVAWSAGFLLGSAGSGIGSVVAVTVRQLLTPSELHARMNASYRLIAFGGIPVGALAGGVLVDALGSRTTMGIAVAVVALSAVPVLTRPVRTLRRLDGPDGGGFKA
ncbi:MULTISPECIES: MFS transporter [Micromonospora]|uniref:Predicted arabinose efflux permease, MFS family n=1 Tax=Micromonospora yangpuensis TaxID=683228 RepID=A0A1C6VGT3_9ACTN|nr:MFS transporter [Micromonospora yangpuensis]GGL99281.1 MFS transporter [Micromonospora yangpuensis]SCL65548.1 Predicted arabinose efflux permease, MFS family [Micromonospora yangpuensis]